MHDMELTPFEQALAGRLRSYSSITVASADAVGIARATMTTGRRTPIGTWWQSMRTPWRVAIVGLLLLAGASATLLAGSLRPTEVLPQPLGANHILYTNGTYECQNLVEINVKTSGTRVIATCSYALLVSPSRLVAAERGPDGVVLIDLTDGSRTPVAVADGQFARPVAWSPTGLWLHWVECGADSPSLSAPQSCQGFIGAPSGTVRNPVPEPPDAGYNGSFQWSADEQRFFIWDDAGVHIAAGDGSGFALGAWSRLQGRFPLAMAPDGRTGGFATGRSAPGGESLNSDLTLIDALDGSQRVLTGNPDGTFIQAVAWSPDGGRIALITTNQGTVFAPYLNPTATLRVIAPDGTEQQRIDLPLYLDGMRCADISSLLDWSPDGGRILINRAAYSDCGDATIPAPIVVDLQTLAQTPLPGTTQPSWSPDGAQIVGMELLGTGGMELVVWDASTGERRLLGTADTGDWSTVIWAP